MRFFEKIRVLKKWRLSTFFVYAVLLLLVSNIHNCFAAEYVELSSLEHGDYRLTLAWKIDNSDFVTDPDGTKFYRTDIIISGNGKGGKESTNVASGVYTTGRTDGFGTPCIILDPKSGVVSVFISVKSRPKTYAMDGYVYRKTEGSSWVKEKAFENKNWGWYAFFGGSDMGNPILCHFSSAGYFAVETKRNNDGYWSSKKVGKIEYDAAIAQYSKHKNVLVSDNSNYDRMTNVYSRPQTTSSMPDVEMMKTMFVLGLFGKAVESVGNAFSATASSSPSSTSASSYIPCNTSEYCFEVIKKKWEDSTSVQYYIKCLKGPRASPYSEECIYYSKGRGKWEDSCGILSSTKDNKKAAGNSACGVY